MPHSQRLPKIPILRRINQIHRTNNYFFKIYFNIVLSSTSKSS